MKVTVVGKLDRQDILVPVQSKQDAYAKGYYNGSVTRWQLEDALLSKNPTMRIHSGATHRGLFDGDKFICGIGFDLTLPYFSLQHAKTGEMLARSWRKILYHVERKGYEINYKKLP